MKTKAIIMMTVLLSTNAYPQTKGGSYYCVSEWAGGGSFNSRTNRWEGTGFRPDLKFVMRATFISTHTDSTYPDLPPEILDEYRITMSKSGSTTPQVCSGFGENQIVQFDRASGTGLCERISEFYAFNLKANRFVKSYIGTYDKGDNKNGDTPVIEGGTCTRID